MLNIIPKIAVITPIAKSDYLVNTVLDGLIELTYENALEFRMTSDFPTPFPTDGFVLPEKEFIDYAKSANLIILTWGKKSTNFALAEKINEWRKTVFVDGSESGKNNRFDAKIQNDILNGIYEGIGAIDAEMLSKCGLYFRREKPYIKGIEPFPFGIERRYRAHYNPSIKKDIDFVCIFGQDEYPILRREAREMLKKFCKKNGFTCMTEKTKGFNFDDTTKVAGRDDFYSALARAKVGISIGGGGFDTARFWEILGNNCILLTEKIDIEAPKGTRLDYSRIREFKSLSDFEELLAAMAKELRTSYNQDTMNDEYADIIREHTSKARVVAMLESARDAGILK